MKSAMDRLQKSKPHNKIHVLAELVGKRESDRSLGARLGSMLGMCRGADPTPTHPLGCCLPALKARAGLVQSCDLRGRFQYINAGKSHSLCDNVPNRPRVKCSEGRVSVLSHFLSQAVGCLILSRRLIAGPAIVGSPIKRHLEPTRDRFQTTKYFHVYTSQYSARHAL